MRIDEVSVARRYTVRASERCSTFEASEIKPVKKSSPRRLSPLCGSPRARKRGVEGGGGGGDIVTFMRVF